MGWHHCAGVWASVELRLCDWPPILCDVLLVHEPSTWPARPSRKLERKQGLQERGLLVAQELGRKGCKLTPSSIRCADDNSNSRASRLHRSEGQWTLQRRHVQVLSTKSAQPFGFFHFLSERIM